jgi:hypothetical protein
MHAIEDFPVIRSKADDEELVDVSIYILGRVEEGLHYLPKNPHATTAIGDIRNAIKQLELIVL